MAKSKKDSSDWVITKGQLARWQKEQQRRRQIIIIVSVIISVVFALLVYAIISESKPYNPTVLKVSSSDIESTFDMDYYVDILRISGIYQIAPSDRVAFGQSVLNSIGSNEVYRVLADELNISASEDEINQRIRNTQYAAQNAGTTNISNTATPSYEELVGQLQFNLEQMDVPFKTYREVIGGDIVRNKVQEHVKEISVPAELEQVRIEGILIDTSAVIMPGSPVTTGSPSFEIPEPIDLDDTVETISLRLASGETFSTLAMEYSQDSATNQNGGDLGWFPQGVLNEEIEKVAFELEINVLSNPIPATSDEGNTNFWLIRIIEKDESRPLEQNHREILENRAFNEWFTLQSAEFTSEIKIDDEDILEAIQKALD